MVQQYILWCVLGVFFVVSIESKFVLLMGPSGAGKSTIIRHLKELDSRFEYVVPLTTRPLRDGEKDKIHVELDEIYSLDAQGKLLTINNIYGIYYATPKYLIDDALAQGKFPILDWPIDKLFLMDNVYGEQLYKIYIEPENVQELKKRLLADNRDVNGQRYMAGLAEMEDLYAGYYDHAIDLRVINAHGYAKEIAELIYKHFIVTLND